MAIKAPAMFTPAAGLTFGKGQAGSGRPKIEHRIGVQAPAEVIWEIISNIEGWADWNPLYPKAEGTLRIGQTLTLTLALPGEPHQTIQPEIVDWVPNDQIHWKLSLMRGLVRTVRFIEIESLGPTSCIISNGEIFQGFLGPSVAQSRRRAIRQGFAEMGEALAARAEASWQAKSGAPTSPS
jgi:hypothetical protein